MRPEPSGCTVSTVERNGTTVSTEPTHDFYGIQTIATIKGKFMNPKEE